MKWEPIDVIRLAALLGGFLLCGLGAWLMWLGVGAEGVVDIKSSVLSGSIKSGSAGLFIIFFGFFIVLFVLATLSSRPHAAATSAKNQWTPQKGIGVAFFVLVGLTAIAGTLAATGHGDGFAGLAMFTGAMALFAGMFFTMMTE